MARAAHDACAPSAGVPQNPNFIFSLPFSFFSTGGTEASGAAAPGERHRPVLEWRRRRALFAGGACGHGRRAAPSSMARGALRPRLPRAQDPRIRGGDGKQRHGGVRSG